LIGPFVVSIRHHETPLRLDWFSKGLIRKYGFRSIIVRIVTAIFFLSPDIEIYMFMSIKRGPSVFSAEMYRFAGT